MRAQSPRRPAGEPRVLGGALLRLNPDTGAGVAGNPLYNAAAPSANASRILAYGIRNPFRFTMRPSTNEIWVADVGLGHLRGDQPDPTPTPAKAPNFGWPCIEKQTHLSGYRDLDMCKALYNDTVDPPTDPYFAYEHGDAVNGNDTCGTVEDGSSITGAAFYTGTRYPASVQQRAVLRRQRAQLHLRHDRGRERSAGPVDRRARSSTTRTTRSRSTSRSTRSRRTSSTSTSPSGTVNRISYASSNRAPVAVASATPTSGAAPLSVQLNGSASTDPDGDALTYSWDIDGNGTFGDATGKTPTVTLHERRHVPGPGARHRHRRPDLDERARCRSRSPARPDRRTPSAPTVTGTPKVGGTLTARRRARGPAPRRSRTRASGSGAPPPRARRTRRP